jgi:hypothetical protein
MNCDFVQYISSIKGIKTEDSASPSDIIDISFKDNVQYDNQRVKKGMLKVYYRPSKETFVDALLDGLDYEMDVLDLVRVLLRIDYCPYFVQPLITQKNCDMKSFINILKLLKKSNDETKKILVRSFLTLLGGFPKEAIDSPLIQIDNLDDFAKHYINLTELPKSLYENLLKSRVSYICTEKIDPNITFRNIDKHYKKFRVKNTLERINLMIGFQVAIALYGFHLLEVMHNDIHEGNIFICEDEEKIVQYKIEDKIYSFSNMGIKVKIYDFDYGYSSLLGDNKKLDSSEIFCQKYKVCNKYIPGKDMLRFSIYSGPERMNKFLDIVANDKAYIVKKYNKLEAYYEDRGTNFYPYTITDDCAAKIKSPLEVVESFAKILNVKIERDNGEKKYDYKITGEIADKIKRCYIKIKNPEPVMINKNLNCNRVPKKSENEVVKTIDKHFFNEYMPKEYKRDKKVQKYCERDWNTINTWGCEDEKIIPHIDIVKNQKKRQYVFGYNIGDYLDCPKYFHVLQAEDMDVKRKLADIFTYCATISETNFPVRIHTSDGIENLEEYPENDRYSYPVMTRDICQLTKNYEMFLYQSKTHENIYFCSKKSPNELYFELEKYGLKYVTL